MIRTLLAVAVLSLQGCYPEGIVDDGCPSPQDFEPLDLTGVWHGWVRDEIPIQYELVQLSPTISLRSRSELSGTVSITIGEVEASGPVTGDTGVASCGSSEEASAQHLGLDAVLSLKPTDNLDLVLTLDFIGTVEEPLLRPGDIAGPLRYAGPTSVTFGPDGEVVELVLDSFSDTFFSLARGPLPLVASDNAAP